MSDRSLELARKRVALQARCEAQRQELGRASETIEVQLARADRVFAIARRVLSAPVLVGVGLAIALFFGPRRLLGLAGKAMLLFSTARRLGRHAGPAEKERALHGALSIVRSGPMH